ncbi:hypothetical protein AMTR_s00151p00057100 [Amborella trichopoda]|uniref:Uncharacterized protein n=1 Tax=Amborella trichopoda TaxID=13333 RepID=W1NI83_AMBTC|nr:hypothetical protein AMTR_s00151p00057100 [Amborella trichopoda]
MRGKKTREMKEDICSRGRTHAINRSRIEDKDEGEEDRFVACGGLEVRMTMKEEEKRRGNCLWRPYILIVANRREEMSEEGQGMGPLSMVTLNFM